uniref:Uncharacterized protein n=1 Tax=Anopheles atroparvus TaxID=41427 RepID=A0AAG5CZN7_ANOAO
MEMFRFKHIFRCAAVGTVAFASELFRSSAVEDVCAGCSGEIDFDVSLGVGDLSICSSSATGSVRSLSSSSKSSFSSSSSSRSSELAVSSNTSPPST